MSGRVRVFQVDAFTSQRFCGNPAGVVLDADALGERDMQALARELNNGDTAFVLAPDSDDHDVRLRFFTPRAEAASVGHATVAAHAVLATLRLGPHRRQKQRSGIIEVETLSRDPPRIAIRQPPPLLGRLLEQPELDPVLAALGLSPGDLDTRCPVRIGGQGGGARLLLGANSAELLARVRPDLTRLRALSALLGAPGFFLFTLRPSLPGVLSEARMFCPAIGIDEDAVSGNAHALLGAHLLQQGLLGPQCAGAADTLAFTAAQGHFLGRPGHITVSLQLQAQSLRSVSISGEAVIVFATQLDF